MGFILHLDYLLMILKSWAYTYEKAATLFHYKNNDHLYSFLNDQDKIIAQGNRRSYGDCSFNPVMISSTKNQNYTHFDEKKGLIYVESGILLSTILSLIVPKGWFLAVSPGTKFITVGGAIASDVHGKNHMHSGCFSQHVQSFRLMLPNGEIMTCSQHEHNDLFHATCGGMGLTGVILDAVLVLKKTTSAFLIQRTIKTTHLKETFNIFEDNRDEPYLVAWLDSVARNNQLGKGLVMTGQFCDDNNLTYKQKKPFSFPFKLLSFLLNPLSLTLFNWYNYHKISTKYSTKKVAIDSFFYPLDSLSNWNNIYGQNGLVQYHFILPMKQSYDGIKAVLNELHTQKKFSYLAVLKRYGKQNKNLLSFPIEGYSLALDFKMEPGLLEFFDQLDSLILQFGGRLYLAKDSRMKQPIFEKSYPNYKTFKTLRKKFNMDNKFHSLLSKRLNI